MADPTRLGLTPDQLAQLVSMSSGGMQFVEPGSSMELGPMSVGPQAQPQPAPPMQLDMSGPPANAASMIFAPGTNSPIPVPLPDAPNSFAPVGPTGQTTRQAPVFQSTGDPQRDALMQAVNDPAQLDSNQLLLLNQKAGGGRGGGYGTSTTKELTQVKQMDTPELKAARAKEDAMRAQIGERTVTLAESQARTQSEVADIELRYAEGLKAHAAESQRLQQENQKRLQSLEGDMTRQRNDYVKAADSLDPKRLVRGKQWLVALSTGLGAFGSTMSGSRNYAMDAINSAIDRDLDVQKTALGAKREAMSFTQQSFANNLTMFSNQMAAREATKADAYAVTAAVARSKATRLKGTELEAGALNFVDELERSANAAHMNALQLEAGTLQTRKVTAPVPGGGGKSQTPLEQLVEAAKGKKVLVDAFGVSDAGGAPDDHDKRQFNQVMQGVASYQESQMSAERLRKLNSSTTELGRRTAFSEDAKKQNTEEKILKAAIAKAASGLSMTQQEREEYQAQLTEGAYTSEGRNTKLGQIQQGLASRMQIQLSTLHPQLQQQAAQRMRAMGLPDKFIKAMMAGTPPSNNSGSEAGAAGGGRAHN